MANNFYAAIGLIGGGIGALDSIDGTDLADGDAATVQTDGTVYFYHLDATSGAAESSPDIIKPDVNAGTKRWIKQVVSGGGAADYIRLHDTKADTVGGGTFTAGAWQKRDIVEDQDLGGHCSVASNVITLAAGTYDCDISCPANRVQYHKGRLQNTTDAITEVLGSNAFNHDVGDVVDTRTEIRGRFTIAASKTFEIQHRCSVTKATNGFGIQSSLGVAEIYTVAEFWKVG